MPKIDRSAHNQIPERVNSKAESGALMNRLSNNPILDRCTCVYGQFFFLLIKSSYLMIEDKTYIK
jgi:hypothetical protein